MVIITSNKADLDETTTSLAQRVKSAVINHKRDAAVLLYGSRARGDARQYSDWDFLVLTQAPLSEIEEDQIRRSIYEIEWETGEVLCPLFDSVKHWQSRSTKLSPLYESVQAEGIPL